MKSPNCKAPLLGGEEGRGNGEGEEEEREGGEGGREGGGEGKGEQREVNNHHKLIMFMKVYVIQMVTPGN